MAQFGANSVVF